MFENVDSTAISGHIFSILMLDRFSQRRIESIDLASKIDLAPKLSKIGPKMAVESAIFRQKVPHNFSDTDPSNLIVSRFYTL